VLPALGYSEEQIRDLEGTIQRCVCDAVVLATPTDLRRTIRIAQPTVRVNYDFDVDLQPLIDQFMGRQVPRKPRPWGRGEGAQYKR
jgi:predicted GTPase